MERRTQHLLLAAAVALALAASTSPASAFVSTRFATKQSSSSCSRPLLFATVIDNDTTTSSVTAAKSKINESIANTDKGRTNLDATQRTYVHSLISNLESLCPLSEPARDPRMEGPWVVLYTDAPPPSNGQLGPFKGIAKQVIDLSDGKYRNELYVGGNGPDNDQDAWLSAILDATWTEWDGVYLDNDTKSTVSSTSAGDNIDHGATTWKVDFESLKLSLFGIPLFTQQFKAGTSRTWKMTYLDDDTRIVRAGKTGRGEDDWIFYMRRGVG